MRTLDVIDRLSWHVPFTFLLILAFTALIFILNFSDIRAFAHSGDTFGPACGNASIDGEVEQDEWSSASTKTFEMINPGASTTFTTTLYVMNNSNYLYLGFTINDDEFSTYGQYLPVGDGFRIDFDNDHSGSLFTLGDDVLGIFAGIPHFEDSYIVGDPSTTSSSADDNGGGTTDGNGAASRVGNLNHFELRHPLCSGDSLDFCLHPADIVGFRLEYLDAQADGEFGGSQFYPGLEGISEADIIIGTCEDSEWFIYLPLVKK